MPLLAHKWFLSLRQGKTSKEMNVAFNGCGKILLKDLRLVIEAKVNSTLNNQKMA